VDSRDSRESEDSFEFVHSRDSSEDERIGDEYYEITSSISRDMIGETQCLAAKKDSQSRSNYKLVMDKCRKIPEQRWRISERNGYIHSGMDDDLCVVPNTDDTSTKKVRIILKECPRFKKQGFEWKFSRNSRENFMIINGKTTLNGKSLVIKAARTVKRFQFLDTEEVAMVPILATMESGDKGQLWQLNPKGKRPR
jgi:hypothetical protein